MADAAASSGGLILKLDDDERVVWGWASVIEEAGKPVVDHQGDEIPEAVLVKAIQGFVVDARKGGVMHIREDGKPVQIGEIVEAMVMTKARQQALGVDLGKVGALIAMKVHDDNVWADAKAGKLPGFSIGGRGTRVELED